jgi:membrane protease YdiL (CAAX protease family)
MSGVGWSIREAMMSFSILVMVAGVGSLGVFGVVDDAADAMNPEVPGVLMVMIGATILGMMAALGYAYKVAGRAAFRWGPVSTRWLFFAVLLTIPVLGLGYGWGLLIEATGREVQPQTFVTAILETPNTAAWLLAGGYGIFGAAILEEMLFRGFIQPPMVTRFGPALGIGLASVVFGLVHSGDPIAIVPTMAIGAVAGWLRHRTGSLGASVVFHAVNNGIALLFSAVG